jgi:uncharacterized protein YggE
MDVSFGLREEEMVRRTSLVQAIADARAKAEAIATLLGRHAGEPLEFVEEPEVPPVIGTCSGRSDSYHLESAQSTAAPVLLGRLAFSSRVRVRFELT